MVSGVRLERIKLVNADTRSFTTSQFLLISEHAHINIQHYITQCNNDVIQGNQVQYSTLTKQDIPRAAFDEPLDVHNVADLPWWLQCHGTKLVYGHVHSRKKQQSVSRLNPLV